MDIITEEDISTRIKRLDKKTAPGVDGEEVKHLKNIKDRKGLSHLNLLSICGRHPTEWKTNKTTLIPKPAKDPKLAENYRPITISSIISRIYWGIIYHRLRQTTKFSPRQKGFVYEAGCFNNVHIFSEILRLAKTRNGMVCVQLDVAKAFDTIPHQAIEPGMIKHEISCQIAYTVANTYKNVQTCMKCNNETMEINLRRGVKQGDPLSPFLFNTILDRLLNQLDSQPGFTIDDDISCLAFADDLLFLADDIPKAHLLSITQQFITNLGMKIANRSAPFRIVSTRNSWYLADPNLCLNTGDKIPSSTADTTLCYLGCNISPWSGLRYKDQYPLLGSTLTRLKQALLKPFQKTNPLSTYIIPHFLHSAILAMTPLSTLRNMDSLIRTNTKEILHLPQCTPNGLIYCSKRDGGLAIPKLETFVTTSTLRQDIILLNIIDSALKALFDQTSLEHRLEAIARAARLEWPNLTYQDLASYKW
jgi:hypothetical protein